MQVHFIQHFSEDSTLLIRQTFAPYKQGIKGFTLVTYWSYIPHIEKHVRGNECLWYYAHNLLGHKIHGSFLSTKEASAYITKSLKNSGFSPFTTTTTTTHYHSLKYKPQAESSPLGRIGLFNPTVFGVFIGLINMAVLFCKHPNISSNHELEATLTRQEKINKQSIRNCCTYPLHKTTSL